MWKIYLIRDGFLQATIFVDVFKNIREKWTLIRLLLYFSFNMSPLYQIYFCKIETISIYVSNSNTTTRGNQYDDEN